MNKRQKLITSFMLFSLFFGAGNLIFPPLLGHSAGHQMPWAMVGFIITAVILPVLGVVVVAKFDGLQKLANKVHPIFSIIFTILIYVSIGPGLGIPRAASVPFEMAIAPYISNKDYLWIYMLIFSLVFFAIAAFVASTPSKLLNRIGKFLTPALLLLMLVTFITYLVKGPHDVITVPLESYQNNAFTQGFLDGYQTMDTIAALNFGLVISTTIQTFSVKKEDEGKYILICGTFAGLILTSIYIMLAYMGMSFGNNIVDPANGAVILRAITYSLFGEFGAVLLASIFLLACLTTCIGLITSISQFFSTLYPKLKYHYLVIGISLFSFIICNQGLNFILDISVPVLNTIYPISIMLIILGLFDKFYKNNKIIYPLTISLVGIMSIIFVLDGYLNYGAFSKVVENIPLYGSGLGWVTFAATGVVSGVIIDNIIKIVSKKHNVLN